MNDCDFQWIPMPRYLMRRRLVKKVLKNDDLNGKDCLEIGYGSGDMLLLYASYGFNAFGYDYSDYAFGQASGLINRNSLKRKITLFQDERQVYERKYNYIFLLEVLEHVEDDRTYLKKLNKLLLPGGSLILSVPAHMSKWNQNDTNTGHLRRYERKDLYNKLLEAGFVNSIIWNYSFPLSLLLDVFLDRYAKSNIVSAENESIEERTKQSGVKRKISLAHKIFSSDILLSPFYVIQNFFLKFDFASAYIARADRADQK